jgi:5'-nucleotidase
MKRVLIDMDEVVVDMLNPWLERYNADWNGDLTRADIKSWDVLEYVRPEAREDMWAYLMEPDFFDGLEPLPGAISGISRIITHGWDPWIVSTPTGPESAASKLRWVDRHLKWTCGISTRETVLIEDKASIRCDAIIDDRPSNLTDMMSRNPDVVVIAMGTPYNEYLSGDVDLWVSRDDTELAWGRIVDFMSRSG